MNNNSNNCGDYEVTCSSCGRPWAVCKEKGGCNGCGDVRFCEYGRRVSGCIRQKQPDCPMQAVIPSVTVENINGIKGLSDCLVHVADINTTYYIDDHHRLLTTWGGPVSVYNYDFDENPLRLRNQMAYDTANNILAIFDKAGVAYTVPISNLDNDYAVLINKPQINGHELSGNQTSAELGLQNELIAGENIQIEDDVISATDTTYTAGNGIELDGTEIKAKIGDGLEFGNNGEIDIADIEQYAHFFDNVADMKSAANLVDGSYARTLGYSAKNDGGGALYKIRNIVNDDVIDESFIIEMGDGSNNLIAEYINTGDIYIEQLGALGLADATDKIQDIIDYSIANNLTIKFGNNHFNISRLQFKTAQLIFEDTQFDVIASSDDVAIDIYNPYKGCEYSNFTVNGIGKTGVKIDEAKNLLVHHIKVNNCQLGIDCVGKYEVTISDSLIKNESDMVDSVGLEVTRSDAVFRNIIIQGFRTGVKTNADIDGTYFENIHIWSTNHDTVRNSIGFDLYYGADLINCYLDTCRIGVNVRNGIRGLRMNNCRWFWNTTHYTDAILDGLNTYLIYFADSTCSRECVLNECFGYRPSTITTAYFSNLAMNEWESWCNVALENPSMFNFDNTPKGRITTLTSDAEAFTDVTNQVTSTTSGVEIDYIGVIKADATTGMKTIGILGSKDRPQVLPLNTYCVYTTGEWDKPDGMAYCYINASGKIEVRVTNEMIGKYVKIHIVCSR